jgi:hypothetical protein
MKQPEYVEKQKRGPSIFLTLLSGGDTGMGKALLQWFVYLLVISLFAAYITRHALVAAVSFMGYAAIDGGSLRLAAIVGAADLLANASCPARDAVNIFLKTTTGSQNGGQPKQ